MNSKKIPFSNEKIRALLNDHPSPFYVYDEAGIREETRALNEAFSWNPGFRNYFAVKATPNPHILKILLEEGSGADCSSEAELEMAKMSGFSGEKIMFSSNNTPEKEFLLAHKVGALINLDDFAHLKIIEELGILPETIFFRYNPGEEFRGNKIIGKPREAKFGMTKEQIINACFEMKRKGVKKFGIHTMISSNELEEEHFIRVARMMFLLILEVRLRTGVTISMLNLGGGLGIPYHPLDKKLDIKLIGEKISEDYEAILKAGNHPDVVLFMECGRYITGPHGYLITKTRQISEKYKTFIGVDASMSDLMRPGIYNAYHHITILGKENEEPRYTYDIVGSLCENNDKFAVNRKLPEVEKQDVLIIHDAGAHSHAMGFNYNGKLRPAEILLQQNGEARKIRRAETLQDYFATIE